MTSSSVIAAIDIGTNSTHMVVARVSSTGFEVITREKNQTRLGEGGGDMKMLSPAAIDRGINALQHMKRIADAHSAKIVAVATSAVREAENSRIFLERARTEANIEVEVISGLEEARLIHSAVLRALPLSETKTVLIDIGGGSTEIVAFTSHDEHFARSFKLGSVRLTHRFFPSHHASHSEIHDARKFTASAIEPVRKKLRRIGAEKYVVTSGTGETLARMCYMLTHNEAPRSMNGATFTRAQLSHVTHMIAESENIDERSMLPGIDPSRADIILAGALILHEIADALDIDEFTYCDHALREGLLINEIQREMPGSLDDADHVALSSAAKLAGRCDDDVQHSQTVARLGCVLFDELSQFFELDPHDRLYLEVAALLANVGITVSHAKHHLHSYYIIRHADLLGLTDHEIELIAQIARYHRKSEPKLHHEPFAALDENDRDRVRLLAAILRVAIGLDRTHDGRVRQLYVHVDRKHLSIEVEASPEIDLDLNIYAAQERTSLLADVFDHKVSITRR